MGEIFGRSKPATPLAWTGERLTTDAGQQVEMEHLHRYLVARNLCRGLDVLDVAAGEGYGSAFLAQTARSVIGVELDDASVDHANKAYATSNLSFVKGDARKLPLADGSVDVVVSFETVEHFYEHDQFLAEVKRVLRPGGRFIISSPERDIYSPIGTPPNPFHVRELTQDEFLALLNTTFAHTVLFGQRPILGTALVAMEHDSASSAPMLTFERRGAEYFEASDGLPRPVYLLAISSDAPLDPVAESLFIDSNTIEMADDIQRQLSEAKAQLAATSSQTVNHLAELSSARKAIASYRTKTTTLSTRLQLVQAEMGGLASRLHLSEGQLANCSAELARVSPELDAVLGSSFWQLSRPFRSLLTRFPRARRNLRRLVKLTWWTVTLQLPKRLAERSRLASSQAASPEVESASGALTGSSVVTTRELMEQHPKLSDAILKDRALKAAFTEEAVLELDRFLARNERISFPVVQSPDISIVIVLWNQAHLTLRCLKALRESGRPSIEVILVDNASSDETGMLLSRLDGVKIISSETNDGFLIGCNRGAAEATGRTLLLLNSDAFVRQGALAAALSQLDSSDDIGAVGGRLILPTGRLQEAGSIIWSDASTLGYARGVDPNASEAMFVRDVDYCSGAFLLTPLTLWNRLGGLDPLYVPAYYEEADYCMRLWESGYRIVYEPRAVIDHYEFGSEEKRGDSTRASQKNRKKFRARYYQSLNQKYLPASETNILAARQRLAAGQRRLLVIDNEVPLSALGSGYPRLIAMLREFVSLGWSVTFFPIHRREMDWDRIRSEIPWEIEVAADWDATLLPKFLEERRGLYQATIISRPDNMAIVRTMLRERPHLFDGTRLIYDAEALFVAREILKAEQAGTPLDAAEMEMRISGEIALADNADAIICVTNEEAEAFRQRLDIPVHVLSHPTETPLTNPPYHERSNFLFVGRLLETDSPNWKGLAWFIGECWPLIRAAIPHANLCVAGHTNEDSHELYAPGVQLLGPVADLAPLYSTSRIFIAPVRFAAGVPIKILEATAAGLPVVGTRLMAQQMNWTPGVEIVAEDEAGVLARDAIRLYQDQRVWDAMRNAAQEDLDRNHSASAFRDTLKQVLEDQ